MWLAAKPKIHWSKNLCCRDKPNPLPNSPFRGLPKIFNKSSDSPKIPKDIKVKKIIVNSALREYALSIKTPKYLTIGKRMAKRTETTKIIKIPPPTGVPALISCNLSKRGIFPFLGASRRLVNLSLYRRSIKGITKTEVIRKENMTRPDTKDRTLDSPIVDIVLTILSLLRCQNNLETTLSKLIEREPLIKTTELPRRWGFKIEITPE